MQRPSQNPFLDLDASTKEAGIQISKDTGRVKTWCRFLGDLVPIAIGHFCSFL